MQIVRLNARNYVYSRDIASRFNSLNNEAGWVLQLFELALDTPPKLPSSATLSIIKISVVTKTSRDSLHSCTETIEWMRRITGAPNENIVQNHLNIALLNVFQYLNGGYGHIFIPYKFFICSDFLAESLVIRKLQGSKLTFSKISARKKAPENSRWPF